MTWIIFRASSLSTSLGTPDDPRRPPLAGFSRTTAAAVRPESVSATRNAAACSLEVISCTTRRSSSMTFSSFVALDEPGAPPSSRVPASIPTALLFGSTPSSLTLASSTRAFFGSAELHARVRAGPIERTRRRGREKDCHERKCQRERRARHGVCGAAGSDASRTRRFSLVPFSTACVPRRRPLAQFYLGTPLVMVTLAIASSRTGRRAVDGQQRQSARESSPGSFPTRRPSSGRSCRTLRGSSPLAPLPSTAAAERSRPRASACPRPPVDDGAPGADVPRR